MFLRGGKRIMEKNIMLVDDSDDVIHSVKLGLENIDKNFNVSTVKSGMQCLQTLANNNELPDLILLDIMMPEMTGWEVYDRLKENKKWAKIPVVFLTARTDKVAENAGRFLADDYIEKPFEINDLKKRIDKIVNK